MKGLIAGALASLMAAGAWAEIKVIDTEFHGDAFNSTYNMTVENESDLPVARLEYRSVFKTPGRSVPWADESGGLDIPGGVEPGETRNLEYIMAPLGVEQAGQQEVVVEIYDLVGIGLDGKPIR
ncbi:MAG: hypothetical protein KA748_02620 [Halomonas sp.]|nr:hypothetical protein [Halomonas sp.]MBP5979076.1 hypothetical protein [Halomonas sp.]